MLTDWHSIHPFWVARGVDHYTTPTDSARADCIRLGAPPRLVEVIGIPVRPEFTTSPSRSPRDRLTELGLDSDRFTILVMVGAEGSPRALRNVAHLAMADSDAQLVVICGRSHELRRRVERLPARMPVRALGFVHDVASLMRATDLLVTKAGGLTLAEAFSCAKPVIIHDLLPGQEMGNLQYLQRFGAVDYAPTPSALVRSVQRLARDSALRARLAACGAQLARPLAARQIAQNVLERLERSA